MRHGTKSHPFKAFFRRILAVLGSPIGLEFQCSGLIDPSLNVEGIKGNRSQCNELDKISHTINSDTRGLAEIFRIASQIAIALDLDICAVAAAHKESQKKGIPNESLYFQLGVIYVRAAILIARTEDRLDLSQNTRNISRPWPFLRLAIMCFSKISGFAAHLDHEEQRLCKDASYRRHGQACIDSAMTAYRNAAALCKQ